MAEKASRGTRYVVLAEVEPKTWREIGEAEASNTEGAYKQVLAKLDDPDGNYVAIPHRSFQPVPVRVKHVAPQLIIGATDDTPTQETLSVGNGASEPVASTSAFKSE